MRGMHQSKQRISLKLIKRADTYMSNREISKMKIKIAQRNQTITCSQQKEEITEFT